MLFLYQVQQTFANYCRLFCMRKPTTYGRKFFIFDGTTHVCEAMVIVLHYVDDWVIKQSVCRLMLLPKSMSGEEVARQIIMTLSTELGIASSLVVAAMRTVCPLTRWQCEQLALYIIRLWILAVIHIHSIMLGST